MYVYFQIRVDLNDMMIDDCINVSIKMPLQGPDSDGHVSIYIIHTYRQILTVSLRGKCLTWNWTDIILNLKYLVCTQEHMVNDCFDT